MGITLVLNFPIAILPLLSTPETVRKRNIVNWEWGDELGSDKVLKCGLNYPRTLHSALASPAAEITGLYQHTQH